jgi:Ras-related protein Rab-1A
MVIPVKIQLMGDGGVGKTTLCRTWVGEGNIQYNSMPGVNLALKKLVHDNPATRNSYNFKFQIWDLTDDPRFQSMREYCSRGARGALCCFDVTNQESYRNIGEWINDFWDWPKKLGIDRGKLPLLIVGTKCDLRGNPTFPNQVASKQGQEYAAELTKLVKEEYGFEIHYIETSAKDQINVDEAFRLLANEIISNVNFRTK